MDEKQYGYQQNNWNSIDGQYHTSGQQYTQPGSGFGIASLVLGILSLIFFWSFLNIPMAILAVIFAIVHLSRGARHTGFAVAGIVTSIISVVLTVLVVITIAIFAFGADSSDYSHTIPFEQFIDGDGDFVPDDSAPFQHGEEHTF